jgi:hypothetical protein
MNEPGHHSSTHPTSSSLDLHAVNSPGDDQEGAGKPSRPEAPSKAETALLPAFEGLSQNQIYVPRTQTECQNAVAEILAAGLAGFDTEARPTSEQDRRAEALTLFNLPSLTKPFSSNFIEATARRPPPISSLPDTSSR